MTKEVKNYLCALALCIFFPVSFAVQGQGFSGSGSGTAGDPYIITTAMQLDEIRNDLAAHYKLDNNIDLAYFLQGSVEGWLPIGNSTTRFIGSLNGAGYKITGLWINRPTEDNIGLFGYIYGAIIKNLGVENCNIIGQDIVGGLVGYSENNSTILNCYVTSNVSGRDIVGGLVGESNNSPLSNCYSTGSVKADNNYIGGLVGFNTARISYCYTMSTVRGNRNYVGGLVGFNYNGIIFNCVAANDSIISFANAANINRIAGYNNDWGFDLIGICRNNYALNTMIVKNSTGNIEITDNLNTIAGMSKEINALQSLEFYFTANNWYNDAWDIFYSTSTWNICNNESLPFLRWQGINCGTFAIIATTGANGTIFPIGSVTVNSGENKKFTFSANSDYVVHQLFVNNVSVPDSIPNGSYTFVNIMENHTIKVTFKIVFCDGDGSVNNPYQICTHEHLKGLADYVNEGNGGSTSGVYYKLMNDIDLNGYTNWNPIGSYSYNDYSKSFQGNFNGNRKVIQNLTINRPTEDFIGLFGIIYKGKLENLGVENCDIVGKNNVGGLMGTCFDSTIVSDCYATGKINGTSQWIGGLVGGNGLNSIISGCYATCTVSGGRYGYIGGLVGCNYTYSTISNCYATGNVSGNPDGVGGLVGSNNRSTIFNCYATGKVSGISRSVAGLVGDNFDGAIRDCVAANDSIICATNLSTNYFNRITSSIYFNVLNNNYALTTMKLIDNNGVVTVADGLNTLAGMGLGMNILQSRNFYATVGNWFAGAWDIVSAASVWDICDGKTLPWLRWQKIDCNNVGIVETLYAASLQIYPNPTSGELKIENKQLKIEKLELYDVYGRKLMSYASSLMSIDIFHLTTGIYFLHIHTNEGLVTRRIVKQ